MSEDTKGLVFNDRDYSLIEYQKFPTSHSSAPSEKAERFFFRTTAGDFKKSNR